MSDNDMRIQEDSLPKDSLPKVDAATFDISELQESKTPTFDALNMRQKMFILAYIEKRVAWKAYEEIYSTKQKPLSREVCDANASESLRKPKMRKALQEKMDSYWEDRDSTVARVFDELKALAFSDIKNYTDETGKIKQFTDIDTRAIKSLSISDTEKGIYAKVELYNKQAALTELADILQIKKQQVEISGQIVYLDKQDLEL